MNIKLVADWRSSWRWLSVHALSLLAILPLVWLNLPADVKALIPSKYGVYVVLIVALGGIAGRLVDQTPKAPSP